MVVADYGCRFFYYMSMLHYSFCAIFEAGASPVTESITIDNFSKTRNEAAEGRISYDNWSCGAFDFDKSLSHQMAVESCPARMSEANLCCVAHDLCYAEVGRTQKECDGAFCFCLRRTVARQRQNITIDDDGCARVATGFCDIVDMFGTFAHQSAQAAATAATIVDGTPTATVTVVPSTTTTKEKEISITAALPSEIAEFVTHNVSLRCYNHKFVGCVEEMHSCVATTRILAAATDRFLTQSVGDEQVAPFADLSLCSARFCTCAERYTLMALNSGRSGNAAVNKECRGAVEFVCHRVADDRFKSDNEQRPMDLHLWSIYFSFADRRATAVDLALAFVGGALGLALLIGTLFSAIQCYKTHWRKHCFQMPDLSALHNKHHHPHVSSINCPYSEFADKKCLSASPPNDCRSFQTSASPSNTTAHFPHKQCSTESSSSFSSLLLPLSNCRGNANANNNNSAILKQHQCIKSSPAEKCDCRQLGGMLKTHSNNKNRNNDYCHNQMNISLSSSKTQLIAADCNSSSNASINSAE